MSSCQGQLDGGDGARLCGGGDARRVRRDDPERQENADQGWQDQGQSQQSGHAR